MKRILVTGADGFINSHLTEMLLSMGGNVRALSQYNSFNDWGWLEQIPPCDNLEEMCGTPWQTSPVPENTWITTLNGLLSRACEQLPGGMPSNIRTDTTPVNPISNP